MPVAMARKRGWFERWLERHQSAVSLRLHLVGIPLTIMAGVLAGYQLYHDWWEAWWLPLAMLITGYLLQYAGHAYEGNDMGELILIKRLLRRPYTAVSPRYARRPGARRSPSSAAPAAASPRSARRRARSAG